MGTSADHTTDPGEKRAGEKVEKMLIAGNSLRNGNERQQGKSWQNAESLAIRLNPIIQMVHKFLLDE